MEIGAELQKRTEVDHIVYTSPDDAWENFKVDYFAGYEELAEDYKDDNPLIYSSSYAIYLSDSAMQGTLVAFLENLGTEQNDIHSNEE